MLRRHNEWSKWISASVDCRTSSLGSNDNNEYRGSCPTGPKDVPSLNGFPLDPVQLCEDYANESIGNNTDQNRGKAFFSRVTSGNSNSSMGIHFHLNNRSIGTELIINKIAQVSHKELTQQNQVLIETVKTVECRL